VGKEAEMKEKVKEKLSIGREDQGRQIIEEDRSWTTQQVEEDTNDSLEHLMEKKEE
jgi:hypothetical protein